MTCCLLPFLRRSSESLWREFEVTAGHVAIWLLVFHRAFEYPLICTNCGAPPSIFPCQVAHVVSEFDDVLVALVA